MRIKNIYESALRHEAQFPDSVAIICREIDFGVASKNEVQRWLYRIRGNTPEIKKMLRKLGYKI